MGNGKIGTAPCGHEGEHIIGQFVRCAEGCEDDAVPVHVEREKTDKLCPHCGSAEVTTYPGFSMTGADIHHCHGCLRTF